jgi:hypothetical protein
MGSAHRTLKSIVHGMGVSDDLSILVVALLSQIGISLGLVLARAFEQLQSLGDLRAVEAIRVGGGIGGP